MAGGHISIHLGAVPGIDSLYREVCVVEDVDHLLPYLKTFFADAGTDKGTQLPCLGAVLLTHPEDYLLGDALDGPLPARMDGGDCVVHFIVQQNRDAVGGAHSYGDAGDIGD